MADAHLPASLSDVTPSALDRRSQYSEGKASYRVTAAKANGSFLIGHSKSVQLRDSLKFTFLFGTFSFLKKKKKYIAHCKGQKSVMSVRPASRVRATDGRPCGSIQNSPFPRGEDSERVPRVCFV